MPKIRTVDLATLKRLKMDSDIAKRIVEELQELDSERAKLEQTLNGLDYKRRGRAKTDPTKRLKDQIKKLKKDMKKWKAKAREKKAVPTA